MTHRQRLLAALIICALLITLGVSTATAQDEEITLQEFMERVVAAVLELQETVAEIAETTAEKSEVRALETRVTALETAMPWPTATPTPSPTPTPSSDVTYNLARELAIADYTASDKDFSSFSQAEQDRITKIYLDLFLQTIAVCELEPAETAAVLDRYAQKRDDLRFPWLQRVTGHYKVSDAGWRFIFIVNIATNSIIQDRIENSSCASYLSWYMS